MAQLTCTRCGFRGDVVTETHKIGGHLFATAALLVAAIIGAGSLGAVATFYFAAHDFVDNRAKLTQIEASLASRTVASAPVDQDIRTMPGSAVDQVPVRLKNGSMGTMPITELSDPSIDRVLTPAEWREHLEGPTKDEIDLDKAGMAVAALLGLLGMGATVVVAGLVKRRQRYWQTYAFCAACNAPLGRLRG